MTSHSALLILELIPNVGPALLMLERFGRDNKPVSSSDPDPDSLPENEPDGMLSTEFDTSGIK